MLEVAGEGAPCFLKTQFIVNTWTERGSGAAHCRLDLIEVSICVRKGQLYTTTKKRRSYHERMSTKQTGNTFTFDRNRDVTVEFVQLIETNTVFSSLFICSYKWPLKFNVTTWGAEHTETDDEFSSWRCETKHRLSQFCSYVFVTGCLHLAPANHLPLRSSALTSI